MLEDHPTNALAVATPTLSFRKCLLIVSATPTLWHAHKKVVNIKQNLSTILKNMKKITTLMLCQSPSVAKYQIVDT
jgi:hypothetical protein